MHDNVPTNDVENTNSTDKEKDFLLANKPRIVPWRTKGSGGTAELLCIDQLIVNESKTRRKNLAMA